MNNPVDLKKYQGQWGGKIDTGEEMWWSGFAPELKDGGWRGRFRFYLDSRHNILIYLFNKVFARLGGTNLKIIDFGCGAGGATLNFSKYLGVRIDGYDIFPTQLELARKQNSEAGLNCTFHLLNKDGTLPIPAGSLDVIFSSDVLGHVPDPKATIQDWSKALRQGGYMILFTEATYSENDHSIMAKLNKFGVDLIGSVPEHISLLPRETLEHYFENAGFEIEERYSASVWHFFLSPKDYIAALKDKNIPGTGKYLFWARVIGFFHKLTPFYPKPQHIARTLVMRLLGKDAYGCNYFYLLKKN